TQQVLLNEHNLKTVTMQIFQKQDNQVVCGIEEVLELFRNCAGFFEKETWISKFSELTIETLKDGETTNAWEPVMHISGPYAYFAHLESVYLGILARRTKVATGVRNVVLAAREKPVIFFADRFDYFANQPGDGYAAKIGGVSSVATDAQASWFGEKGVGTIPHALIAINNGDTISAAEQFAKHYPQIPLIVLVDFDNDCVQTSLAVARALGNKLYGVRMDTSEKLIDKSLEIWNGEKASDSPPELLRSNIPPITDGNEPVTELQNLHGVNPQLVKNVRKALNTEGFDKIKIVVSGGFNAEKIEKFEQQQTPVDMYGVGSSLLRGHAEFTADIVKVDNKEIAKFGRKFQSSKKLQDIDSK
ncbi:MAG: quinolinate phosphoribosyl transferase, partial [Patescibacteria group bacterium]|nr:quinolinate phosphoribosyl transferase [Patescibacteria group bacterium]